jgi:hypothetical protein
LLWFASEYSLQNHFTIVALKQSACFSICRCPCLCQCFHNFKNDRCPQLTVVRITLLCLNVRLPAAFSQRKLMKLCTHITTVIVPLSTPLRFLNVQKWWTEKNKQMRSILFWFYNNSMSSERCRLHLLYSCSTVRFWEYFFLGSRLMSLLPAPRWRSDLRRYFFRNIKMKNSE